jgi:hypothetical protein
MATDPFSSEKTVSIGKENRSSDALQGEAPQLCLV